MVELRAPFQAAEEGRKEDTKETAQFEHVDHAEKVLHQAEAEAEIHVEEIRRQIHVEVSTVPQFASQTESSLCKFACTIILGDKIAIQATSTELLRYDACTVAERQCR